MCMYMYIDMYTHIVIVCMIYIYVYMYMVFYLYVGSPWRCTSLQRLELTCDHAPQLKQPRAPLWWARGVAHL